MDLTMALMQPLMMVITTVVSAVAGWIGAKYKAAKADAATEKKQQDAMLKCCRLMMGARMEDLCNTFEEYESPTKEQRQHLINEWELYRDIGGDGWTTETVQRLVGVDLEKYEAKKEAKDE